MSFHVVVDASDAWVDNRVTEVSNTLVQTLGTDKKYISSLQDAGMESLFGDVPVSIVQLNDASNVKSFVDQWEKMKDDDREEIISYGLVVASTVNRNSTRKLESIAKKWGTLHLSRENSKDKVSPAEKMLAETKLSSDVKKYILQRVGDDYAQAVSVLKDISSIPPKLQPKVSVEDIALRMPLPPGSIPPWEIEKPLMDGDVTEAITTWRRISQNSHPLVVTSLMKKKISLLLRISTVLKIEGNISKSNMAEKLGENDNYPFKISYDAARARQYDKIVKASEVMFSLEKNLKGESKADQDILMENAIINLCRYLRK